MVRKINFKNPFRQTKTFTVTVKPNCFFTSTNTMEIEGKKQARVLVGLELLPVDSATLGGTYPRTGKMTVQCEDSAGVWIKWPFYLEEECTGGAMPSEKSSMSISSVTTAKSSKSTKSRSIRSTPSSKSSKSTKSTRS